MKTKIVFLFAVFSLLLLCCSGENKTKEPAWQGKIEYEDGIKVIKNPSEPVYGEILLDLEEDLSIGREDDENYIFYRASNLTLDSQDNIYVLDSGNHRIQKFDPTGFYLHTIGKKGQGPGEFERPSKLFLDNKDNIYVLDSRNIKVFNSGGNFVKNITLKSSISDFYVDSSGNIFAIATFRRENERKRAVVKMDPSGKVKESVAEFSDVQSAERKGNEGSVRFTVYHSYSPRVCLSRINEQSFSFAFALEYQIFVMNTDCNLLLKIQKEEKPNLIAREEKVAIMKDIGEHTSRRDQKWPEDVLEEACNFPDHRPFFWWIGVDDKQRLYVWHMNSVLEKSEEEEFDLFNKEGCYLYQVKIPVVPYLMKKGFIYDIKEDKDTGAVRVRRFRIRNWNHIKDKL